MLHTFIPQLRSPTQFQHFGLRATILCKAASSLLVLQLEWVEGELWGNVWQSECIARIDPATGAVRGWILLDGLTQRAIQAGSGYQIDVLNGTVRPRVVAPPQSSVPCPYTL